MTKQFDFVGRRKVFIGISLAILLVGIVCNFIFGVELDIAFKGGTLLKYSFAGDIDNGAVEQVIKEKLPDASVTISESDLADNTISVELSRRIDLAEQDGLLEALTAAYPDHGIERINVYALEPANGRWFFIKCLVAIGLAAIFLVIYVGLRFRKIGGLSAGIMALLALLNDLLVAYFAFVIFRIPLDDNFVAVVLSILGYSLNDTIVIYDRIRENRRIMDKKTPIAEVVNVSLNQSFVRTMNTTICTFIAVATVAVLALATSMDSIVSFAVPMMFGVVSGFYTSTCLCSPIWVAWVEHKEKRKLRRKRRKEVLTVLTTGTGDESPVPVLSYHPEAPSHGAGFGRRLSWGKPAGNPEYQEESPPWRFPAACVPPFFPRVGAHLIPFRMGWYASMCRHAGETALCP